MNSSGFPKFIFFFIVLLVVGYWGYNRYNQHKTYDNISRLDYLPADSIDYNYYNQSLLNTYLDNCAKLTDMAKVLWLKDGVDINNPKVSYGEIQSKINHYLSLMKYTKILEAKLLESHDLKDQGLDNDLIETILDKGLTIGAVENDKDKMTSYEFLKGKNVSAHSSPSEIWEMQKLLNANDYNLNINGVFDASTDSALLDFQKNNNLYPSHVCDDITLKKLVD